METLFDDIPDEPEYPPDTGPWMSTAKLHAGLEGMAASAQKLQMSIAQAFDVPLDILVEPTVPPPVSEAEVTAAFNPPSEVEEAAAVFAAAAKAVEPSYLAMKAKQSSLITMPLEKSHGPKWLPGGMGPVKPIVDEVSDPAVEQALLDPHEKALNKYGFTKTPTPAPEHPFTGDELDNLNQDQILDKLIEGHSYGKAAQAMDWNKPLAPVTTGHSWLKDLLSKPAPQTVMLKLPLTMVAHNGPWEETELTFEAQSHLGDCKVVLTNGQWVNLGKPQNLTVQILGGE